MENQSTINMAIDITLFDVDGKYVGTVRVTVGYEQPSQIEYEGRLFDQSGSKDNVYFERNTSTKAKDCYAIPEHFL